MKKTIPFFTSMLMILLLSNCEEILSEEKHCLDSTATNYVANATYDCDAKDINKTDYAASSTAESCCTYPTEEEIAAAEALIEEANQLVAQANLDVFANLGEVVETDIDSTFYESPGSEINEIINMEDPYGKYEEALVLDPTNKGAHFGIGLMEVTLTSQDELLESTLNEWAACFDSLGMFGDATKAPTESESTMPRSNINNNGYEKGIPQSGKAFFTYDALRILDYLPIITSHNNVLGRVHEVCPEISSIQDLLENVFLSRISTAISHLDKVVGTDFVFEITPAMLEGIIDDPDQPPIDIDDTEIYLMKALMHQLRAIIYAVITYNVNVPYYDLIEIEHSSTENLMGIETYTETRIRIGMPGIDYNWQWLAQDSDFLSIRSGQESSGSNAHADLNNVLNSIESAWAFLQTDTDTDSDIITMDMVTNDISDEDINEFLDEAREVLNENYEASFRSEVCEPTTEFSGLPYGGPNCYYTDSLKLTINIKNFLTNPPQNLKEILPDYTIATGNCEYEEWNAKTNNYEIIEWGCPEFSWVAKTCQEWKDEWDETLGGLLPNMTTTKLFINVMGLDDEDCEEILEGNLDF